jgi:hypothetical protein
MNLNLEKQSLKKHSSFSSKNNRGSGSGDFSFLNVKKGVSIPQQESESLKISTF